VSGTLGGSSEVKVSPIVSLLKYDDAPAAIDWPRNGSLIMLSSTRSDERGLTSPRRLPGTAHVVYVVGPGVPALFDNLRAGSAELLGPLEHDEHGILRFQAKDIEGHVWNLSDYDPLR
jgi:uncharacterized glyoxalase superfamily protein PhnB